MTGKEIVNLIRKLREEGMSAEKIKLDLLLIYDRIIKDICLHIYEETRKAT